MGDAANTATNFGACPSEGCPPNASLCVTGACVVPTCTIGAPNSIAHHCDKSSVAGVLARRLCPETCGCDAPRSPLALSLPMSGCGDKCVRSGKYLARRMALPCADMLPTDPEFAAFLDNWDLVRMDWPNDWQYGGWNYVEGIRLSGCGFLNNMTAMTENIGPGTGRMGSQGWAPYLFGINACVEDGTFFPVKPLSYFCPVACGCHAGDPHCPDSCPARTPSTPLCPDELLQTAEAGFPFPSGSNVDWFSPSPYQLSIGEVNATCPLTPKNRF